MKYVIAGGGAYGCHYLKKLKKAASKGAISVDEIIVVDRDAQCIAAKEVPHIQNAKLHVSDWFHFGQQIWEDQSAWRDSVWVPAPIAPHILAQWVLDRFLTELQLGAVRVREPIELPDIPFAKSLPDGRVLLSHAPGTCPLDCIEPEICAITTKHRWWEMRETIQVAFHGAKSGLNIENVAMFFCKHHCDIGEHDVGGVRFRTIYEEYDRLRAQADQGQSRIGIATFSSCHGILNVYDLVQA